MAAPKGNEFYKFVKNPGRPPKYASSKGLLSKCKEYFQWVEDNPFHGKARPYTIQGLCLFLGISRETWNTYKDHKDFSDIYTLVNDTIFDHKFTGAASNIFNHNIIARDLGLADKRVQENKNPDEMSPEQLLEKLAAIQKEALEDDV